MGVDDKAMDRTVLNELYEATPGILHESQDKEENEFEVESLVAKGRIGRRVWYKVKWKGYPETDNSWVRKKDIGTGAIANYESRHPQGQGEFRFEKLVAKREGDGITLYGAKWHGQPESENIWVDKWDIGAKVIATFEDDLSRENWC
ncbi:hypothetical protein ACJ41O_005986 [Fusarium nematophilum]